MRVEAFVCRKPDENREDAAPEHLLPGATAACMGSRTRWTMSATSPGGPDGATAVDADEADRQVGQVLEVVDSTSMRCWSWDFGRRFNEWQWRLFAVSRCRTCRLFAHLRPTTMQSAQRDEKELGG